jgi:predicted AAA+ superfamily ATPase
MEGENVYYERLLRSTLQVLESDLPAIFAMDYSSVQNLKKLLYLLASMVPFKPNISRLALQLGVTRSTLLHYLEMLDRAQILSLLSSEADGINYLNKPEKIYLNNTNLMYGLNPMLVNTGSMRETFFYNQLSCLHKIHYTSAGDFLVDRTWSFETGGRSKGERQIKNIPHAFLVKDDIEYGHGNIIPLWVFGFLY